MDAVFQAVANELLKLGLSGVVIFGLGFWVFNQQKRINNLTDTLITMSGEMAKASAELSAAMHRLADSVKGKTE